MAVWLQIIHLLTFRLSRLFNNSKGSRLSGSKVYDGGSVVLASELPTISGLIGSETVVTGNQTTTSTSLSTGARKNVASNVAVQSNASGITVSNGLNGGLAANYTLTGGTHQVNITKAPVSVALSRQYDGSTNASSNATDSNTSETFSGLVGSETLTFRARSVSSKNYSASTQSYIRIASNWRSIRCNSIKWWTCIEL